MSEPLPVLIGIAGGSGSGKTYLARYIQERVGVEHVALLSMDQYFKSLSPAELELPARDINFDHPSRLDLALLRQHLHQLRTGTAITAPAYDFVSQVQTPEAVEIPARPVILVEGLFILLPTLVECFDLTIFLQVDADQRLIGRLLRDLEEREHSIAWNIDRYQRFVRQSYQRFVEPTIQQADLVVDFTYRRVFFQQMLARLIQDYVHEGFDLKALSASVRGDGFRLGLIADTIPPVVQPLEVPLTAQSPDEQPTLWVADNLNGHTHPPLGVPPRNPLKLKSERDSG